MNIVNPPRNDVSLPAGQIRTNPIWIAATARRTLWIVATDSVVITHFSINTWVICDNEGGILFSYTGSLFNNLPTRITRLFKRKA